MNISSITKKPTVILITLLALFFFQIRAQNEYPDNQVKILFLDKYPYTEVLAFLQKPDTLLFCHYPLRFYEERKAPTAVNLFIYKKNKEWWATSLIEYSSNKKKYWKLTRPMWIQTDLTEKFQGVLSELNSNNETEDLSTIHTWIYINYGKQIIKDLIGNIRNYSDLYPAFSNLFMIAFLESYNQVVIKSYYTR